MSHPLVTMVTMQQSFNFADMEDAVTLSNIDEKTSGPKGGRRQAARSSQPGYEWRLNRTTRTIGLAGVKSAKAILASKDQTKNTAAA